MSRPLFDELTLVGERLMTARDVLIGLDYDGTLTPIVDDPSQAALRTETREIVRALSRQPGTVVAILSGRALDDLRQLVGLDGVVYAGNHGLDISGPGLRFIDTAAVDYQSALEQLSERLVARLAHVQGVLVEDKALTISVHFRRVPSPQWRQLRLIVESEVAGDPRFHVHPGNHVLEVRPRVDWHKGWALGWISDQLGMPDALVCYLGDDHTDEDAFRVYRDGITVRVGEPAASAAHYHLAGPLEVRQFLWLANLCRERRGL